MYANKIIKAFLTKSWR